MQSSSHLAGLRHRPAGLLQHRQALVGGKQRRLAGMNADREHEPVSQPHGVAHHVEMAIGDRVKRPRVKGNSRHMAGSNPPFYARQGRRRAPYPFSP